MKFNKPKFWDSNNFISILLYPFSFITILVNFYKKMSQKNIFKIKIICIGNLYIGGTGKTSLTIEIHNFLKKKYKTVFIKKNYKNQKDEINLLGNRGQIIYNKSRLKALTFAQKYRFQLALMDDGLQQKNIKYNLKIACFNSEEGLGNGYLLPAGPLRESMSELKYCDIAVINGEKRNIKLERNIKKINKNIKIFKGKYEPKNLNNFNLNKSYLMFCGIGNPKEFERTLIKHNFKVKNKILFPDHYSFSSEEIKNIKNTAKKRKLNIITTEKDYFRLSKKQRENIDYLKVKLKIKELNRFKKISKI